MIVIVVGEQRTKRRQHYHHIIVNNLKAYVEHWGKVTFAFSDFNNLLM